MPATIHRISYSYWALSAAVLSLGSAASGATYSVLYNFAGGTSDGANPYGSLTLSGSTLYGMTSAGGSKSDGTIFAFDPATSTESVLYSFGSQSGDGTNPEGSLALSGADFYGMTDNGGANREGTIFSFNPANNSERVLHDFGSSTTDGTFPQGALIQSGGELYGYGQNGGANGKGTIFSYNTQTSAYTTLYSFDPPGSSDGSIPYGDLLLDGTTLYGMTRLGGAHSADGEIFSFDTSTSTYTILHSFDGTDGGSPYGSLMLDGSTLYGMTETGGTHSDGVIFSVALPEPGTLALLAAAAGGLLVRRRRSSL